MIYFLILGGLPPTMTDKDSDNPITDNEEPEVIFVKQNIEARGESVWTIETEVITTHGRRRSKERFYVHHWD